MKTVRVIGLALSAAGLITIVAYSLRIASRRPALYQKAEQKIARQSPADRRLAAAQLMIQRFPSRPDGYRLLCSAYMQKARETGDFDFNHEAEKALSRAQQIAPDNYDAIKLRAKLLLTYHRFDEALREARRAEQLNANDHDVYGALMDALVELGEYDEAIAAAQKMVDLRPDSAAYARVSYLRSLHGDTEGAIEAMMTAAKAADPRDPESVAWCRVHIGEEMMKAGMLAAAEQQFDKALFALPDYHLALAQKARARAAAGDFAAAIKIYQRQQETGPTADAALALGDVYTKLGRTDEAQKQYQLFETLERENARQENDWHHLIYYWADRGINLDEALAHARRARAARADIYTCDALAWTLFRKGQTAEAKVAIEEALRLKTRDARILYHTSRIYHRLGDGPSASKYLQLAVKLSPALDLLQRDVAQRELDSRKS